MHPAVLCWLSRQIIGYPPVILYKKEGVCFAIGLSRVGLVYTRPLSSPVGTTMNNLPRLLRRVNLISIKSQLGVSV